SPQKPVLRLKNETGDGVRGIKSEFLTILLVQEEEVALLTKIAYQPMVPDRPRLETGTVRQVLNFGILIRKERKVLESMNVHLPMESTLESLKS
ncbi:MAG: hypothetical protein JXR29_10440, partial [Methylothermaceae bacterium]|nr:hypothetical protein [Methylothermaceae bacterium]